jgi:hypothetical protein
MTKDMSTIIRSVLFFTLLFSGFTKTIAQVTITGPSCVIAGTVYQYSISAKWDSTSTMHICVNGGIIADSSLGDNNTCTPSGAPVARMLVIWNDSASNNGSLSLTSSLGNASFAVHFTDPLLPGSIDSVTGNQQIGYDSIPATIICSIDTGGSCSPSYSYQWQQSLDQVNWVNVDGANSMNLTIQAPLVQTMFYRRKVIDINSSTVGYSNVASVFVGISSF